MKKSRTRTLAQKLDAIADRMKDAASHACSQNCDVSFVDRLREQSCLARMAARLCEAIGV